MSLSEFFSNPAFRVLGIPTIFVVVGVYANRLALRDGDDRSWTESWVICTSTLLMTIGTIVADMQQPGASTNELIAWLVAALCFIFASVEHERFRSWRINDDGIPVRRPVVGVLIPALASLAFFVAYQSTKV